MDRIRIIGGNRLDGRIPVSGAKNATLPLMIASLLTDQTLTLENVPNLADVALLKRILGNHGVDVTTDECLDGFADVIGEDDFPGGRFVADRILTLPTHPYITDYYINLITSTIRSSVCDSNR